MDKNNLVYSTHHQSQAVIAALKHYGIKHVVISSGSRNAPLTLPITSDEYFKCYSVIDERSAGFFAMGIAKEVGQTVALVCTSGSAVLNYYPAVAEAFYSRIPIVILSADRPASMIDKGMGQTIHQEGVLSLHCSYSTTLLEGIDDVEHNVREISHALEVAAETSSPVHINIPFAEPLYSVVSEPMMFSFEDNVEKENEQIIIPSEVIEKWRNARRPMVICGAHHRNEKLEKTLNALHDECGVITLCENTSNLHSESFIENIDRVIVPLSSDEQEALKPDFLISIGGMIVSKKIKSFLSSSTMYHIHVHDHVWPDTYGQLSCGVKCCDTDFLSGLLKVKKERVDYSSMWLEMNVRSKKSHDKYSSTAPYSDYYIWNTLSGCIPSDTHLEIANSSSIRYSQLFNFNDDITIWCNRGTSGIDGSTSTAVGAAIGSERTVTHITGDLSFFYDSNALWNNYLPSSMRIIVINNGGGGIFRILDGSRDSHCCEGFLEARHRLSAKHLACMHNVDYMCANDEKSLKESLEGFWDQSKRARLLEIFTPSDVNDTVLRDYFKYLIREK